MCSLRMNCGVLLAWVFALRFLRGYLRFARGFDVNDRQLAVNASQWFFGLALLAMFVNVLWVWLAMVVNGFATAWLWKWSLMLRASHAEGRFVGLCFLRGYLRFARFFNVVLNHAERDS